MNISSKTIYNQISASNTNTNNLPKSVDNLNKISSIMQVNNPNLINKINNNNNFKNRSKPLSMNEAMINQIIREPNKKKHLANSKPNSKTNFSQSKLPKNNSKESINNSIIDYNCSEISLTTNSNVTSMKAVKSQPSNMTPEHVRIKEVVPASKIKSKVVFMNKKTNVISLNHEIPLPNNRHLQKNPSNGSNLEIPSNSINQMSHTNSININNSLNQKEFYITGSSDISTRSSNTLDSIKLNEELLDYKLNNSKLKNEVSILNEKIKTLKQVIIMKTDENEMIKSNYSEIIEECKKESEKVRKIHSEYISMKDIINKQTYHLNSIISIMTELIEIFVSSKSPYAFGNSNIMTRQSITINNENASATDIDVYYSYNNDDDKRNTLIEQIQGLLVAKLSMIKRSFHNVDIDKEIEKIKMWNFTKNPNESEINISNLRISKNIIEESCSESFRKNCSNDFFDLSISNQIIPQSPKFNSAADSDYSVSVTSYKKDKERSESNKNEKNRDNFLLNDSFLNDLKQSKNIRSNFR
jgi:hypothetical protein